MWAGAAGRSGDVPGRRRIERCAGHRRAAERSPRRAPRRATFPHFLAWRGNGSSSPGREKGGRPPEVRGALEVRGAPEVRGARVLSRDCPPRPGAPGRGAPLPRGAGASRPRRRSGHPRAGRSRDERSRPGRWRAGLENPTVDRKRSNGATPAWPTAEWTYSNGAMTPLLHHSFRMSGTCVLRRPRSSRSCRSRRPVRPTTRAARRPGNLLGVFFLVPGSRRPSRRGSTRPSLGGSRLALSTTVSATDAGAGP